MEYDPSNLAPGTVIDGRLRIEGKAIGSGSYATVYLALHTGLDKLLAMKVLHQNIAMNEGPARKRFFREARLLARIQHRNIVSVQDVKENGVCFITMEYIPGEDAHARMQRGPLPLLEALYVVDGVLQGLETVHAHDPPIYHRDIKPENIRLELDANGNVKRVVLIDFGIAHFRPDESAQDRQMTDTKLGTYAYMSPEQENGDADVDHRTDIFSVGAVLWALLKGTAPNNIVFADRDPKMLAGIPKAVAKIIRRAVQYNMAKRYPDVAAMRHDVRKVMEELSRPEKVRRPWLARMRNPFPGRTVNWRGLAMIAAALTATVGSGVAWRMMPNDPPTAADVAPTAQVASRTPFVPTPTETKAAAEPAAAVEAPPDMEIAPQPVAVQTAVESSKPTLVVEIVPKPPVAEETPAVMQKPKTTKVEAPPDKSARLVHKVVKKAAAGSPIPIAADAKNVTVKEISLCSRTADTARWNCEVMRPEPKVGYQATVTSDGPDVEYYIKATDAAGKLIPGSGDRFTYYTIDVQ